MRIKRRNLVSRANKPINSRAAGEQLHQWLLTLKHDGSPQGLDCGNVADELNRVAKALLSVGSGNAFATERSRAVVSKL